MLEPCAGTDEMGGAPCAPISCAAPARPPSRPAWGRGLAIAPGRSFAARDRPANAWRSSGS